MEFFRGLQKVGQLWKLMYYKNISFLEFEWAKKKSYIFDGMKARKQVKRVRAQMITRLSILRHLNEYQSWVLSVNGAFDAVRISNEPRSQVAEWERK